MLSNIIHKVTGYSIAQKVNGHCTKIEMDFIQKLIRYFIITERKSYIYGII